MTMNDINSIAYELLHDEGFLISLSQNTIFVKNLSQNKDFVNAVSKNPVFIDSVMSDPTYIEGVQDILSDNFDIYFDAMLANSKHQPLAKIAKLEAATGLGVFYSDDEEEEQEPTLPERIHELEVKIENIKFRPTVSPAIDKIPETKTELRASFLVEALEASGKAYFSANDIITFLKCKLPESCKIDEKVKNIRKVKQDVVSKAVELFSSIVESNKKKTGHGDVRLILKS